MSREGSVFRRCKCGGAVHNDRCREHPEHGGKDLRWCFKIDVGAERGTRRTVSGTFPTRNAAVAARDAIRHDQASGSYIQRSRQTTAEYMDHWLEIIAARLAANTLRQYERYWQRLEPLL